MPLRQPPATHWQCHGPRTVDDFQLEFASDRLGRRRAAQDWRLPVTLARQAYKTDSEARIDDSMIMRRRAELNLKPSHFVALVDSERARPGIGTRSLRALAISQ